ncbi:uncharacterized protein M6B38_175225 [Iris pallida]|uniref:Uncharacterized protein n=1 Tax=Iris pallida TaxID=29817 RepID=A0AAX6ER40_IRIPA|nr:uncharacterized protein M6B38_175225 [Iris pallida]
MAHPNKFVSVNLNKSYGKPTTSPSTASNVRHHSYSSSGGGGMVVLSRHRGGSLSSTLPKSSTPKLSVPAPLNLPSLRKENEKFGPHGSNLGSSARPGSSGSGSGPGTSIGWTKPAAFLPEKELAPRSAVPDGSAYMPPAARAPASSPAVEKAVFLKGDDFPSLKAATFIPKQKELKAGEERVRSPLPMRPQMRSSRLVTTNAADGDDRSVSEQSRKQQMQVQDRYFLGPLPVVNLAHTSNWADDERDTGLNLPDRDRDRGFQRLDFDEVGSVPFKDFHRGDSFGMNRDGRDAVNSWRGPPQSPPQLGFDRDRFRPKPPSAGREMNSHLLYVESARAGLSEGPHDSRYPRRDLGFGGANFQNGKSLSAEGFPGRVNEQQNMHNGRIGDPSNNRNRGDTFQNNIAPKVPFSAGSKGLSVNDPILNFGRDKRLSSSSGKPYSLDAGFDSTDPFSDDPIGEVNVKVFKRKKEVLKQMDFHDPVRASFEAELERVQRIQEQERQRAMEEQARVMELARREQEERERLVREEEERRRLIEEEAREAAWRAEQERMDAARRVEEQKIAREEEKRRIVIEEERRKEAARKKLLELEARMAKRQTDAPYKDDNITGEERVHVPVKERDVPKVASDVGDWEDGERMVEHITSTASSNSSNTNRYFETGSCRIQPLRDENTSFMERGKHGNYWKRDAYDNGSSSVFHLQDQESDLYSSRRDTSSSGRPWTRKENFGFPSASTRPSSKGGTSENSSGPDDLHYPRGNRWNGGGDGDHFNRIDATDFSDNDKFADGGWGSGRSRGSPNAPYTERSFQNEVDGGFPSFGRSRHSLRQPRVLPPPSISSMRHTSFRNEANSPGPTSFLDSQSRYHNAVRSGEIMRSGYDQRDQTPRVQKLLDSDVIASEQKEEKDSPRCDSQSSLSVSNPPSSPTHLSHDGFDEADDNPALDTSFVEEHTFISDNEHIASEMEVGNTNTMGTSSTVSHEEDDEWAIEKNEEMNEQEDYDEEEDGYQEDEEAVHDGDGGETLEFNQEFNDPPSDLPNKTGETGQMVLDFNEAVDASIGTVGGFEKTFRNDEKGRGVQDDSVGDDNLQDGSASFEGLIGESSITMNKTEKALQELTLDPLPTPTSSYPESTEASSTQGTSIQQQITSGFSSPVPPTSTAQPTTSTVSAVENQAEAPIRLQFGLFSGPSLIPSPVPAIQIGSIQMPLHLPPPQPPFFQFGQLRYPSPLSQGILPLAPQTVSFIHPPPPASSQHSSSQNLGGSLHSQASQVPSSQNSAPDKVPSGLPEDQLSLIMKPLALSQGNINYKQQDELSNPLKGETVSRGQTSISSLGGDKTRNVSGYQNERHIVNDVNMRKNYRPVSHNKEIQVYPGPSRILTEERTQIGSRATGIISNSRGRRFTYSARNASTRPLFPVPETSRTDSGGLQRRLRRSVRRTEFRVRENVDRREREVLESYSSVSQDGRPNFNGRVSGTSARYGVRKDGGPTKLTKTTIESENLNSGVSSTGVASSRGQVYKLSGRETLSNTRASSLENLQAGEGSGKNNASSEEDVGAPLQSGVVCVFRQSGIEAPSDEDDFIEVRSKRQMLNDRREQREKEIRAKSKAIKAPRKHRAVPQSNAVAYNFKKSASFFVGDATNTLHSDAVTTDGRGFPSAEASPVFTTNMTSQTLPPIGTPAEEVDSDARSITLKSSQISCVPGTSSCATVIPVLPFEKKNTVLVNAPLPSGSWSNSDINQQVMALTQSQLDDAMKPVVFDSHVTSSLSIEPTKSSTPIMAQEKPFPPSACPLNSLLAGERIQFGAVTSPTILPPISRAVSNGIGPPDSSRSDVSKEHSLTAINKDCTMLFDKERHTDESCTQLEDPEAEAAASAVAVAAIMNNDEIVGNRLGACSVSDSKSFTAADNTELPSGVGMTASKEVTSQSMAEESLSVALPADLSVDTPLPLWHPLPSPQGTSSPMLSHFSQPSHFPIVDVNSMFGGPFFAFGPHDESGGTQAQPPRSTTLGSGPLGPWPHHSGVDSFYGPPTGFAGPYISPPGGIPGVQAAPHMVVYNHFAPVGQFGPVFMGTTYIPTGKQPDWKHNPVSSATGVSEGEVTNLNFASVPRNPPILPSPLQHLAPGSPLMPMASPLPIFDMSPFQSSADIPFQARWSHVPAPSIHSVPSTVPPPQQQQHQQQVEGDMASQFGRTVPVDTSTTTNRFDDPSTTTTDGDGGLSVSNDGANQFPDELSLAQPPTVSTSSLQAVRPSYSSPSSANNSKGSNGSKGSSRSAAGSASEGGKIAGSSFKRHVSQQQLVTPAPQQLIHPTGHGDQRGGSSQKMGSGGEWHRRGVNQGRGHGLGPDKSFGPSKMKQIYVAKPPSSGPAASTS